MTAAARLSLDTMLISERASVSILPPSTFRGYPMGVWGDLVRGHPTRGCATGGYPIGD